MRWEPKRRSRRFVQTSRFKKMRKVRKEWQAGTDRDGKRQLLAGQTAVEFARLNLPSSRRTTTACQRNGNGKNER